MPRFKDFWVGKHMEVLRGGKFQKDVKAQDCSQSSTLPTSSNELFTSLYFLATNQPSFK